MAKDVSLRDYIARLRAELEAAVHDTSPKKVHFELAEIEVELSTQVKTTKEGGLSFHVLSGKGTKEAQSSQVLRLKLGPYMEDGSGKKKTLKMSKPR